MKSYRLLKIRYALVTLSFLLVASAYAADKKAPPAKPANQYAAFDTHPNEHVTIAADPCDDSKDCSFFRLAYISTASSPSASSSPTTATPPSRSKRCASSSSPPAAT